MLSSAIGELQTQEKDMVELMEQRNGTLVALQDAAERRTPMAAILEMQEYVDYLDNCIARKQAEISRAHEEVTMKQENLNSKALDEKVWLKARDKALGIFKQNMNLREQNELDEMATVRFAMKSL